MAIELLEARDALERIDVCSRSGGRVLGVDGFRLSPDGYVAPLDLILDLSRGEFTPASAEAAAIRFVQLNAANDVRFEVVTDENPLGS